MMSFPSLVRRPTVVAIAMPSVKAYWSFSAFPSESAGQPLRPAGAARNQGYGKGSGRPRHDDLIRDALVMAARGIRLEQIRVEIRVVARPAGYLARVAFVEDPNL